MICGSSSRHSVKKTHFVRDQTARLRQANPPSRKEVGESLQNILRRLGRLANASVTHDDRDSMVSDALQQLFHVLSNRERPCALVHHIVSDAEGLASVGVDRLRHG